MSVPSLPSKTNIKNNFDEWIQYYHQLHQLIFESNTFNTANTKNALWEKAQDPVNWEKRVIKLYGLEHPCLSNSCCTSSIQYDGEYEIFVLNGKEDCVLCDQCFSEMRYQCDSVKLKCLHE